jgi:hypothetical protein
MAKEVRKEVKTPAEYREAIDAAEVLGLEMHDYSFMGTWFSKDNEIPCWPGVNTKIIEDGRLYFKVQIDGEPEKIYPEDDEKAKIVLKFK